MATFNKFEDIKAWQRARGITKEIYLICKSEKITKDFSLIDQMKRCSVSIMANIAEGHGRRTGAEFANFLSIARGSAIELQSHLYVALDQNYVDKTTFERIYAMLDEVSKMTVSLSQYLRNKK